MRVAIIGSRCCKGLQADNLIKEVPRNCTMLLSGGAEGVDRMARQVAGRLSLPLVEFFPDYARYGRKAPLIRNMQLISESELVLAFWDFTSRGTAHAIAQCIEQHVPVRIIPISDRNRTDMDQ